MSELVKFLADQSDKGVEEVIGQFSILEPGQRYQLQCSILDHITEKVYDLGTKAEAFWEYVKGDKESWGPHHEDEQALEGAFPALPEVRRFSSRVLILLIGVQLIP
jgi:hypothetical protein